MTLRSTLLVVLLLLVLPPTGTHARWAAPTQAPVERLLRNATLYVEEVPEDPQGYYVLGRVHSLIFAREATSVAIWPLRYDERRYWGAASASGTEELEDWPTAPQIAQLPFQQGFGGDREVVGPWPPEALPEALEAALRNLRQAVTMDPEQAIFHLGLAYVLEAGCRFAGAADTPDLLGIPEPRLEPERAAELRAAVAALGDADPSVRATAAATLLDDLGDAVGLLSGQREAADAVAREQIAQLLTAYWRELALRSYHAAYARAIDAELDADAVPFGDRQLGLASFTGYEAAEGYLRLVTARGVRDEQEQVRVDAVRADLARLEALPDPAFVTPILFSLTDARPLPELLQPGCPVSFDLDGDGRAEAWPWVQPDTGLLVWDPHGTGLITSGRQLFGSATWWMHFRDGYEALAALDDDRDGLVAGPELEGLAVWFDRDGDAVSDAGEVQPVTRLGIVALAASATSRVGRSPSHPGGLRLADGRRLPTYDWVTRPAAATPRP